MLTRLPETYKISLIHAISKMRIEDEIIWSRIAAHIASIHNEMTLRSLSTLVYSLTHISLLKPVILNFDDLFTAIELSLIIRFQEAFD